MVSSENPDIIFCQKPRVDSSISNTEIFPPGYAIYRRDRDLHGGGVSMLVRDTLNSLHCVDFENNSELVWAAITLKDRRTMSLGSFCRPPDKNQTTWTHYETLLI